MTTIHSIDRSPVRRRSFRSWVGVVLRALLRGLILSGTTGPSAAGAYAAREAPQVVSGDARAQAEIAMLETLWRL